MSRLRKDGTLAKRPNWTIVTQLQADITALQANAQHDRQLLAELHERHEATLTDLAEARQQVQHQRETVRVALDTAEHAVPRSPSVVAYCVVAGCAIVGWEMLAHLVAEVTR